MGVPRRDLPPDLWNSVSCGSAVVTRRVSSSWTSCVNERADYGYSCFWDLYRAWEARLSPTMRQTLAGERLFVDYARTTLEVMTG